MNNSTVQRPGINAVETNKGKMQTRGSTVLEDYYHVMLRTGDVTDKKAALFNLSDISSSRPLAEDILKDIIYSLSNDDEEVKRFAIKGVRNANNLNKELIADTTTALLTILNDGKLSSNTRYDAAMALKERYEGLKEGEDNKDKPSSLNLIILKGRVRENLMKYTDSFGNSILFSEDMDLEKRISLKQLKEEKDVLSKELEELNAKKTGLKNKLKLMSTIEFWIIVAGFTVVTATSISVLTLNSAK